MRKIFFPSVALLLYYFTPLSPHLDLYAQDQIFSLSNQTKYLIDANAQTTITQTITFTNLTEEYYLPDYTMSLEQGDIENLWAKQSNQKAIPFTTTYENEKTVVDFDFAGNVIGPKGSFTWNLGYNSNKITEKKGQIYEITIPQLVNLDNFNSYNLELQVSKKLGQKSYVSPLPSTQREDNDFYYYTYTQTELKESSVMAAFGVYQIFDFTLKYDLFNPGGEKVYTEIAFPSDKNNQQVFLETVVPPPLNTRIDDDGNILARYELESQQKLQITISGYAKVWFLEYNLQESGIIFDIPQGFSVYTQSLKYWEADDDEIRTLAEELTKDKQKVSEKAQAIFDYVTRTLTYNDARLSDNPYRFGAKEALNKKDQAVCMEYTDLYIALARAVKIPAREIDGYAYNAKESIGYVDALHAWVEIYIPPFGWVPIDPTWSSTASSLDYFSKLDTNHLALVTKGVSSETPYPPGTYKRDSEKEGNILVSFSESVREANQQISFSLAQNANEEQKLQIAGIFPQKATLTVKNNSAFTVYKGHLNLQTEILKIKGDTEFNNLIIPPFGEVALPVLITNPKLFDFGEDNLKIIFTGQDLLEKQIAEKTAHPVRLTPILWNLMPMAIGILGGIMIIGAVFAVMTIQDKKKR